MASTTLLRSSYPELIRDYSPLLCDYSTTVPVRFLAAGPYSSGWINLRFHPAARQAARALASVFLAARYSFDEPAGGSLSCRAITGGTKTSLHAHGIALDINPSRNPYRPTILSRRTDLWGVVGPVEAIRCVGGAAAWSWGGRWLRGNDSMHFQIAALRAVLARGINLATVPGWAAYLDFERGTPSGTEGEDGLIPLDPGRVRPIVSRLQLALNRAAAENLWAGFVPLSPDGRAGDGTLAAARRYRHDAGLEPTPAGIVFDGPTIGALLALYADDSDG